MSPYEDRILDVKMVGGLSGSVTVTVEEDLQRRRLLFLAFGIMLLLMAPIVSSWVPFYYSSSMAIGVCLVIIVLLFQGMKLLPTGRKNIFYLTIYGSMLGAGSVLVHQFSMLINSIVSNFGLGEEFHNPSNWFASTPPQKERNNFFRLASDWARIVWSNRINHSCITEVSLKPG